MIDDLALAGATITLRVNSFRSVTQGVMVTSGASPEVQSAVSGHARLVRNTNDVLTVSGGSPGGNALILRIEVLPAEDYDAVGLFIRKVSSVPIGSDDWDDYRVGTGPNSHAVTVRDWCVVPAGTTVDYRVFMLIKRKGAGAGSPLDDLGLIDPRIINV